MLPTIKCKHLLAFLLLRGVEGFFRLFLSKLRPRFELGYRHYKGRVLPLDDRSICSLFMVLRADPELHYPLRKFNQNIFCYWSAGSDLPWLLLFKLLLFIYLIYILYQKFFNFSSCTFMSKSTIFWYNTLSKKIGILRVGLEPTVFRL